MNEEQENLKIKASKPKFSFLPLHGCLSIFYTDCEIIAFNIREDKPTETLSIINTLISVLSKEVWVEAAYIMEEGATKYSFEGWKNQDIYLFTDALLRHAFEINFGISHDTDSGYSHEAHCLCNLLIIKWKLENGPKIS